MTIIYFIGTVAADGGNDGLLSLLILHKSGFGTLKLLMSTPSSSSVLSPFLISNSLGAPHYHYYYAAADYYYWYVAVAYNYRQLLSLTHLMMLPPSLKYLLLLLQHHHHLLLLLR